MIADGENQMDLSAADLAEIKAAVDEVLAAGRAAADAGKTAAEVEAEMNKVLERRVAKFMFRKSVAEPFLDHLRAAGVIS